MSHFPQTVVYAKGLDLSYTLAITFPVCYEPPHWRYKPHELLTHFIGHEGPGSLHSYLKSRGWCTDLGSYSHTLGRGFSEFTTIIQLSPEGFRELHLILP